jgi:hypothetical protein
MVILPALSLTPTRVRPGRRMRSARFGESFPLASISDIFISPRYTRSTAYESGSNLPLVLPVLAVLRGGTMTPPSFSSSTPKLIAMLSGDRQPYS